MISKHPLFVYPSTSTSSTSPQQRDQDRSSTNLQNLQKNKTVKARLTDLPGPSHIQPQNSFSKLIFTKTLVLFNEIFKIPKLSLLFSQNDQCCPSLDYIWNYDSRPTHIPLPCQSLSKIFPICVASPPFFFIKKMVWLFTISFIYSKITKKQKNKKKIWPLLFKFFWYSERKRQCKKNWGVKVFFFLKYSLKI